MMRVRVIDSTRTVTAGWMVVQADAGNIAFEDAMPMASGETARGLYRAPLGDKKHYILPQGFAPFAGELAGAPC